MRSAYFFTVLLIAFMALVIPLDAAGNDDNKSARAEDICQVHHKKMSKVNVEISYGLPAKATRDYYSLRSQYFPNSSDPVMGGCVVTDQKYAQRYVCDECNIEREKYKVSWAAGQG